MARESKVWSLSFNLTEYTPGEVEQMTGLSTTMQRDWRFRHYLPKSPKHARFDMFAVAEIAIMKMFADQGKGPASSHPFAPKIARRLIKTALVWREDAWTGKAADEFSKIPRFSRAPTSGEEGQYKFVAMFKDDPRPPVPNLTIEDWVANQEVREAYEKREWLTDHLLFGLGLGNERWGEQAIWWPTGEVEIASYSDENFHRPDANEPFDRVDPKFEGPALVLDIMSVAYNLVRRSPRPFLAVSAEVDPSVTVPEFSGELPRDLGHVSVTVGRNAKEAK